MTCTNCWENRARRGHPLCTPCFQRLSTDCTAPLCQFCQRSPARADELCRRCLHWISGYEHYPRWLYNNEIFFKPFVAFHGTSLDAAKSIIESRTLRPSDRNRQLGEGVYVASLDKARQYADDAGQRGRGGGGPAIVVVLVTATRVARYPHASDAMAERWYARGYDACFVDETARSELPEMCIIDLSKLDVLSYIVPQ